MGGTHTDIQKGFQAVDERFDELAERLTAVADGVHGVSSRVERLDDLTGSGLRTVADGVAVLAEQMSRHND